MTKTSTRVAAAAAVLVATVGLLYVTTRGSDDVPVSAGSGSAVAEDPSNDSVPSDDVPGSSVVVSTTETADEPQTTTSSSTTTTVAPERSPEDIARQRSELNGDVAAVFGYVGQTYASTDAERDFGGVAFDVASDPVRLIVTFGKSLEAHSTALAPRLVNPDRVDVGAQPTVDVDAVRNEIARRDLRFSSYGPREWSVAVSLEPGSEAAAEGLLTEFGTAVQLSVGLFRYPIVPEMGSICRELEGLADPRSDLVLDLSLDRTTWRRDETITATMLVTNNSSEDLVFDRRVGGVLVAPNTATALTGFFGASTADFQGVTVRPGETSEPLTIRVPNASCDAKHGSLQPAGEFMVTAGLMGAVGQVPVEIVE